MWEEEGGKQPTAGELIRSINTIISAVAALVNWQTLPSVTGELVDCTVGKSTAQFVESIRTITTTVTTNCPRQTVAIAALKFVPSAVSRVCRSEPSYIMWGLSLVGGNIEDCQLLCWGKVGRSEPSYIMWVMNDLLR